MSSGPKEARREVEKFRKMMEEIEDYLPEAEHCSLDDGTEWESVQ